MNVFVKQEKQQSIFDTSVLFMVFNRPDTTKQVFEAIRNAKPPRLYIASDGPRASKTDELNVVNYVRDFILSNIDWKCEVKTLFRDTNLGCRNAITGAIDWFFEHEKSGIILEDDCLPSQSFFKFCESLLVKYEHDSRVMCISGNNFFPSKNQSPYSYHFSEISLIWGWATWKRAWELNKIAIDRFQEIQANQIQLSPNIKANKMWWKKIGKTYKKEIDTWDYLWSFTNLINHGLTVIPKNNLVTNIGMAHVNSTHTKVLKKNFIIEKKEIDFPLLHPPFISQDFTFDNLMYKNNYNVRPLWKRIIVELKRRLGMF